MKAFSIKQKLVLNLSLLFFGAWLIVTITTLYAEYKGFENDLKQTLESHLQEILIEWAHYEPYHLPAETALDELTDWEQEFERLQIWEKGNLVYNSHPQRVDIPIAQTGFVTLENGLAFVYKSKAQSSFTIAVQLHSEATGSLWDFVFFPQILPFLLILPLVSFALYKIIGHSLTPLQNLAEQITVQDPRQLQQIVLERTPVETIPLIQAFNQLVQRLNQSFDKEKRFTANAAHELLTPLAAIKSETQLYQEQFSADTERQAAIQEINQRIDRATHTVKQLLLLSRYENKQQPSPTHNINLDHICQELLSEMGNDLEAKHLQLDYKVQGSTEIQGYPDAISALCRNLIDNAIRYCPEQGEINLTLNNSEQQLNINLTNSCNSLTYMLKEQLMEPFVRGPGEKSPGSGIGLALCQQISHMHQGHMQLDVTEKSFEVQVNLPYQFIGAEMVS